MLLNKWWAIFFIFLSYSSAIQSKRPAARGNGLADETTTLKNRSIKSKIKSAGGVVLNANARIGSRPPSCINKCDSCTPCQAVQASQSLAEMSSNIGSRPPSCHNKCNRCLPCQAVQVPTPIQRSKIPIHPSSTKHYETSSSSSSSASSSSASSSSSSSSISGGPSTDHGEQQVSVEYSNYKPEGWRCKCGNKLFNP